MALHRPALAGAALVLGVALLWVVAGLWPQTSVVPAPATAKEAVASPVGVVQVPLPDVVRTGPSPAGPLRRIESAAKGGGNEVCGFGTVQPDDDDPLGLQQVPQRLRSAALGEADARMLSSADERIRAAALLIGAREHDGHAHARIDRLAAMASSTRDAVVYAMALQGCRAWDAEEAGSCRLLNRAQWTRLDPDNVLPWLEAAREAREQQQPALQEDAMFHAALATHSDAHAGLLPVLVDLALGSNRSLTRTLALAASWSVQAAWDLPPSDEALRYCDEGVLGDANRRPLCESLARTLAYHGSSLLDLSVGVALGRSLGWPEERLNPLRDERDALGEAGRFQGLALDFSCDAIEAQQAWMHKLAQGGETQAARQLIASSGMPLTQWSRQSRVNLQLATAAARAAAASATP